MRLRILSYMTLVFVLVCSGLLDVWISIIVLGVSPSVGYFWHGVLLCLYVLENWVLYKDLSTKAQPMMKMKETQQTYVQIIDKLTIEKRCLESNNRDLAHQIHQLSQGTFVDRYAWWCRENTEALVRQPHHASLRLTKHEFSDMA